MEPALRAASGGAGGAGRSRRRRSHRGLVWGLSLAAVGAVVVALVVVQLLRSVPAPSAQAHLPRSLHQVPTPAGDALPWPSEGSADVEVPGELTAAPHGSGQPVPIASVTKVMTALVLLRDHPLSPGEAGPTITVSAAEAAEAAADQAAGDSVVPLTAGEQLSEYQCLEAMLLPSADDVAQLVATWDAGSEAAFVTEMNAQAAAWGLTDTHFADASGLDPGSTSTAADLLVLAQQAEANPVIAAVVAEGSVALPGSTTPFPSTDYVLGHDGIDGIKTGSDDAAEGCFLFSAHVTAGGRTAVVDGDVLGQEDAQGYLDPAFEHAEALVTAVGRILGGIDLVRRGEQVGWLTGPDGTRVPLDAASTLRVVALPGSRVLSSLHRERLRAGQPVTAGTTVGRLHVVANGAGHDVAVVAGRTLGPPAWWWRVVRT